MIGIFNDNFPPILDGVALTAQNYAYWLNKRGEDVCVVTPYAPDSEEVINAAPYPVYRYTSIPIPMRKPYRLGLPHVDLPFLRKLRTIKFDLVHAHCPFTSGRMARHIARTQNIPVIATFHSKYRQDFERAVSSKFIVDKAIKNIIEFYESVDEVWIPQAAVEPTIREYGYKGRVEVVENGNDMTMPLQEIEALRTQTRRELGIGDNETMLLYVGQHTWEKNLGLTIDALAQLKDIPFRFYTVGTGYAAEEMVQKVTDSGLDGKVKMLGVIYDRAELSRYYAAADIFLFPSKYDTDGIVIHEAAAMHTPSVLMAGSTAANNIRDGFNGFLTQDSISEYAALIRHLTANPQLVRQAGDRASETIVRSWENVVEEVIQRYNDIKKRHNTHAII